MMTKLIALLLGASIAAFAGVPPAVAGGGSGTLFISSATEGPGGTATFPLYRGTSGGRTVYYVVLDTSNGNVSAALGVNTASKLRTARGTAAVQEVARNPDGTIDFPATVDFSPVRTVAGTPGTGFPPTQADPGSVGEAGYSPLIELPDGTVENAPQIGNDSGWHDKVVAVDVTRGRVTLQETDGVQGGRPVRYISTDASDPAIAALEGSTFAPGLAAAPYAGGDGTDSARASLAAFVNGQTGADNPDRQGVNSALLGEGDPLNVLAWNPTQGRYSPLWDVHPAAWTTAAIASGANARQVDFFKVAHLAEDGLIVGGFGGSFRAVDVVVNCPIVFRAG
jgi:hypothetical protein